MCILIQVFINIVYEIFKILKYKIKKNNMVNLLLSF